MDHKLRKIVNLHITQNKPYLLPPPPPKKLHTLCFNFHLGITVISQEIGKITKISKIGR